MRNLIGLRAWVVVLVVTFLMTNSPAWAKGKEGGPPAGFGKGEKKGWEGDEPPGWTQGEKKGWGDAGMPPGLAKKSSESEAEGKAKKTKKEKKEKKDKKKKD